MQRRNSIYGCNEGSKHFIENTGEIYKTVNDFWAWYASDLLSNILCGALAEFIVATALGIDTKKLELIGKHMI